MVKHQERVHLGSGIPLPVAEYLTPNQLELLRKEFKLSRITLALRSGIDLGVADVDTGEGVLREHLRLVSDDKGKYIGYPIALGLGFKRPEKQAPTSGVSALRRNWSRRY